jgi:hypothetical protein
MFDLVEGTKVIKAISASTGTNADLVGDYINMENLHKVWVLINWDGGDTSPDIGFQLASDYAATGTSTAANAKWWVNTETTAHENWVRSTATSFIAKADLGVATTRYTVIGMFDPASAASSNTHVALHLTARNGCVAASYICEPRYKGVNQFIATTS